ncbi:MAG: hydantoinase/oxoprolinase family protein [Clostridia bacterium]|nr:hydantoinase/oxoprolinase family protein [Clostridia bacterium]
MKLGIGIDTGGTYTDAVIYDFEQRAVLGSAKALTTKHDLTIGILGAIDALPIDLLRKAEVISLSTTLATNACVEDKGGRAKLIFFGGDKGVIDRYGRACGLPPVNEICLQESCTSFSGEAQKEPDWDAFQRAIETGFEGLDGVGIVEMNATRNGAAAEKKAKAIFQEKYDIPVVCGHELFSELNVLKRGASTLLNAGLFPVISAFLASVKKALEERDIHPAAMVIVRSNGSLMSEEFAALHPVETLICGPAASAIGCAWLTDSPNSIVVDMGGTTTDIAFVENGVPVTVTSGVSIGKWKTFVNGLYVRTFGLGGDSAVHYQGKKLYLEEYRVVPLCVAAKQYPAVKENLKHLEKRVHTRFLYEHYMLVRDIENSAIYSEEEKALCRALKNGPMLISDAAAAIGKDMYTLRADRLIKDGVVQLCGFTPTDAMHIKGDFTAFDAEAAQVGAEFIAFNLGITAEELCEAVYDAVKKKMYVNIVKAMLENKYPDYMKNGVNSDVERFISESYEEAKSGENSLFSAVFRTNYTLVGAGAPIGVFLKDVAAMLGTEAVIPENHHVANALGAVIGSVSADCTVEIGSQDGDYVVFGENGGTVFEKLEDAIAFACTQAEEKARAEAVRRGAKGEITMTMDINTNDAEVRGIKVYLGTKVTAHAAGAMGFQ